MTDYASLKVPELKKLLTDRSLATSGNKADLIARLQEEDKKADAKAVPAPNKEDAEDEIDWDDEDAKATTAPAAAAIAAGGQGQIATPAAVPNQVADIDPAKTSDLTVKEAQKTSTDANDAPPAPAEPEKPKVDFSIGIGQTDAEKEAEKRAARAKRFGMEVDEEEKRKAERVKKFGIESGAAGAMVRGLDDALPERRKRGREDKEEGRKESGKRQAPDRRTEAAKKGVPARTGSAKKMGSVLDDPVEKAKAEARAEKFRQAATA